MCHGSGLAQHVRLGQHPDASLAVRGISGMGQPDILDICKEMPGYCGTFFFDSSIGAGAVIRSIPLIPSLCFRINQTTADIWSPGHMAYFSQFFDYWRGGLKIMIRFVCSQFTTATIRITHNPYNQNPSDPEAYGGDHVSEVQDIRGSCVYTKTIPYMSSDTWTRVAGFHQPTSTPDTTLDVDSLTISVINPAQTTDEVGDSSVFYSIYICGAEDFDLRNYQGLTLRPAENENAPVELGRMVKKQSLKDQFKAKFPSIIPALAGIEAGYSKSESCTNIVELLHIETKATFEANPYPIPNYTSMSNQGLWLMRVFQFWRGSLRYRYIKDDPARVSLNTNAYLSSWQPDPLPANWAANMVNPYVLRAPGTGDLAVEVPWQFKNQVIPFQPEVVADDFNWENYPAQVIALENGAGYTGMYTSVGDDFMLGGLVPPPRFSIPDYVPPKIKEAREQAVSSSSASAGSKPRAVETSYLSDSEFAEVLKKRYDLEVPRI
jgi:hypothetical protein